MRCNFYRLIKQHTPNGTSAVYIYDEASSTGEMYYLLSDYLGSVQMVVDEHMDIMAQYSYDAWGVRREADTWENQYDVNQNCADPSNSFFYRGYTGHEHLDCFMLINMNNRLYDPVIGRMVSPDNLVADVTSTQDYNRYNYAYGNPLTYVDPSGDEPVTATIITISVIVGAYVGGALVNDTYNVSEWAWDERKTYYGIGIGGLVGFFAGAKLGAAVTAKKMSATKLLFQTYGGFINAFNNYEQGQGFWKTTGFFKIGFIGSVLAMADVNPLSNFINAYTGFGNIVIAGLDGENPESYRQRQLFISGMLSSYAAAGLYKALTNPAKSKAFFGNNSKESKAKATKLANKYGIQSLLSGYAHDPEQEFFKKNNWYDYMYMYGFAGIGGMARHDLSLLHGSMENIFVRKSAALALRFTGYSVEHLLMNFKKGNYNNIYMSGWEQKARYNFYKSVFYGTGI